jgi:hypothetical protein
MYSIRPNIGLKDAEHRMEYVQKVHTDKYLTLSGSSGYIRSGHKQLIAVNNYTQHSSEQADKPFDNCVQRERGGYKCMVILRVSPCFRSHCLPTASYIICL